MNSVYLDSRSESLIFSDLSLLDKPRRGRFEFFMFILLFESEELNELENIERLGLGGD